MISQSITAQVRNWSYQTHSLDSVLNQAPTFDWISLSIMPTLCQTAKKLSNKPSSTIQKCKFLLTSSLLAGPRTSRKFLIPSAHTGKTDRPSLSRTTASIPSRNNKVTFACVQKFLLAGHKQGHQRSSMPVWSLHLVPEPECCSTPHTYTYTITPMVDVCHRYLHARRNWPPGSGQLLLKDDLCSMPSTQPEQCQQGHLAAEGDVSRAWHPWSPLLWQWPTICECPVHWLLYILRHNTWNLKSALPTIQRICQGMCQVCQTCTPMSQVLWCQSTACLTSTPSHTHWHQASISSRATVPMPTQNSHSGQDMQQWPISHTSPWVDWHTLWSC